jgi:hypothetical protein
VRAMLRHWSPFVLLLALALSGCSGNERSSGTATTGNYSLAQARTFADFPLYAPGEAFDDLPLTALVRRFDDAPDAPPVRENFVDFIYGSCDASEGGCAPPLSVQVWAACERNPMTYGPELEREGPLEIRSVPAYFFDGGRQLELSTGMSTVVIFATGRDVALSAANALEGINNEVPAGAPLPPPAYAMQDGGVTSVIPCTYEDPTQRVEQDPAKAAAVAAALEKALSRGTTHGDNKKVRTVECFRSGAIEPAIAVDDVHTCAITWEDGSGVSWCVFSSGKDAVASSLPVSCEEAGAGTPLEPAEPAPAGAVVGDAALAWGAHAEAACGPWREKQMQAIAELDQDLLYEDLSYIWFVQRPSEAGIVRDLRVIPGREGPARRAVALYERRLATIDAGLSAWQKGKQARALADFDRAQRLSTPLGGLFARLHADVCAPM